MAEKVVVFTGAGVSAESGLKTFRDMGGLWNEYAIEDVASPDGWKKDPSVVLSFYNERRRAVLAAQPNAAHTAIASLEAKFDVVVVTQNIDDLGTLPNSAARQSRSTLIGAMHGQSLGPAVDWLLRSANPPYDSLQDLCNDYRLGKLSSNSVADVLAFHTVWIDQRSQIQDGQLHLYVALMKGLDKDLCSVGYRVLGTDRIIRRGSFSASQFIWGEEEDLWIGMLSTSQKPGDVVQCFASYDGRAQHQAWVIDKKRPQNPRRAIYVMQDEGLERLEGWLTPKLGQKGPKQNEFEFAVNALGWMLGFGAQHFDRTFGNPKAPDGIFVCDAGVVVVECTTGPFGPEKLSKLLTRRNDVRELLTASGHNGIPVECAIVAPLTAQELEIGRRAAAEFGAGFIAKDSLAALLLRTYRLPDANQLFQELQQSIREKKELFDRDQSSE